MRALTKQIVIGAFLLLACSLTYANESAYQRPFGLFGGHLQTIVPYLFASVPEVSFRRERWELDDGDFIDVDWVEGSRSHETDSPIVVLFHGLEGSSRSHYAKALMNAISDKGWRGAVVHFRGCSGEPNRLPRVYYAGDSEEIQRVLARIKLLAGDAKVYAVGYSLGGNALLKWLGESREEASRYLVKAAAVSAPVDVGATARALDNGLNRLLYTPIFVRSMRTKALELASRFPGLLDVARIETAETIQDIDNAVTAVLYGASDAADYYAKNSAKPSLSHIALPVLMINSKNDPFIPVEHLPAYSDISESVTLDYQENGGHVGFASSIFSSEVDWLPKRLIRYFETD